ncbi:MAG: RHS repeat-associated core domain-containing protein [Bacteroidia bacterium]
MKKIATLLLFFLCVIKIHAKEERYIVKRTGSSINNSAILTIEDKAYSAMQAPYSSWSGQFYNQKVVNNVYLRYTGAKKDFDYTSSTAWQLTVTYNYKAYDECGNVATQYNNEQITIKYNPTLPFEDIALKQYNITYGSGTTCSDFSGHLFSIQVTNVQITPSGLNGGVANLTDDFILEGEIYVERYYLSFNSSGIVLGTPNIFSKLTTANTVLPNATHLNPIGTDKIDLAWDFVPGAEEYDLEWLHIFVSNPSIPANITNALANIDFSQASRITTWQNSYELNLNFEQGILLFRVRALGRKAPLGIDDIYEGPWSPYGSGTANYIVIDNSYDKDRNWTYNAVYAEDGKKKETLTFFDGSLRNRQSTVENNSDNVALVGETIYDKEGRPAVTTMPTPAGSSNLKFYQNYNLNGSALPFSKADFDAVTNYSNPGPIAGGTGSVYYGSSSTNEGFDAFLPNSGGFTYVRTLFGMDGRVRKASAPGPDHKIGSGHETEYFYPAPSQAKLDMLFGAEAGISKYFKEIITRDANGQMSSTYKNLRGQVVATALIGDPYNENGAPLLKPLTTAQTITIKADFNNKNNYYPLQQAWIIQDPIFVSSANSLYNFEYDINSEAFQNVCNAKNYDCVYDLTITFVDECNQALNEDAGSTNDVLLPATPLVFTFNNISPGSPQTLTWNVTFPNIGTYTIYKKLTLNQANLTSVVNAFQADITDPLNTTQSCYKNSVDLTSAVDNTNCNQCNNNCGPGVGAEKGCEMLLIQMKKDMSPGGQYFDNTPPGSTASPSNTWFNTYVAQSDPLYQVYWYQGNTAGTPNDITGSPNHSITNFWQIFENWAINLSSVNPIYPYFQHHPGLFPYHPIAPPVPAPSVCSFPNASSLGISTWDWQALRNNWDPCFADFLVYYHPQYCEYEYCKNTSPSREFISNIMANANTAGWSTTAPHDYVSSGCSFPLATSGSGLKKLIYDVNYGLPLSQIPGGIYLTDVNNILYNNLINNYSNSGGTDAWSYAASITPGGTCDDQWAAFAGVFVTEVNNLIVTIKKSSECKCATDNDGDGLADVGNINPNFHYPDAVPAGFQVIPCQETITYPPVTQTGGATDPWGITIQGYNATSTCGQIAVATVQITPTGLSNTDFIDIFYNGNSIVNLSGGVINNPNLGFSGFINKLKNAINTYYPNNITVEPNFNASFDGSTNILTLYANPDYNSPQNNHQYNGTNFVINSSFIGSFATPYPVLNGGVDCNDANSDASGDQPPSWQSGSDGSYTQSNCMCEEMNQIIESITGVAIGSNTAIPAPASTDPIYGQVASAYNTAYPGLSVTASDVFNWISNCNTTAGDPDTYDEQTPEQPIVTTIPDKLKCYELQDDCNAQITSITGYYQDIITQQQIAQIVLQFKNDYIAHCMGQPNSSNVVTNGSFKEAFTYTYTEKEYQFTLYYYDLAGNLVRTVTPDAIDEFNFNPTHTAMMIAYRADHNPATNSTIPTPLLSYLRSAANIFNVPNTLQVSYYKFNTVNKVIQQNTPDGGLTNFYYDAVSRLRFSQNAKQAAVTCTGCGNNAYSYTKYDDLGRVTEVGQSTQDASGPLTGQTNNATFPTDYSASNTQITRTFYDDIFGPALNTWAVYNYFNDPQNKLGPQNFLRTRIASVTYQDNDFDLDPLTYDHATHYSYDPHGNVEYLVQENDKMAAVFSTINQKFKKIKYEFDLVSNKVNKVLYQEDYEDQFFHRYCYDADNRILEAQTSKNGWLWDLEAEYFYYKHGPLARMELGKYKTQAMDYYYTLQGWLKGVNSNLITPTNDPGKDGNDQASVNGAIYNSSFNDLHNNVGRDAFGYSLHYYQIQTAPSGGAFNLSVAGNDYVPVKTSVLSALQSPFAPQYQNANLVLASPNLYNGNISRMTTAGVNADPTSLSYTQHFPQLTAYMYDQLNRLTDMKAYRDINFTTNLWDNGSTYDASYETAMTYDENGNIKTLKRNGRLGGGNPLLMDDLTYGYNIFTGNNNKKSNNQLLGVNDAVPPTNYLNVDIDDQGTIDANISGAFNYSYSPIGELVVDKAEQIDNIEWTVSGKISKITRSATSTKSDLEFQYDAMGNRVAKIEKLKASPGVYTNSLYWPETYYVRDATGKVLATYVSSTIPLHKVLKAPEFDIYGGSRIGLYAAGNNNLTGAISPPQAKMSFANFTATKRYELSNHLDNVLTVITDRKVALDNVFTTASGGNYNYVNGEYVSVTPGTGNYSVSSDGVTDYYKTEITAATDYYPFGAPMIGRQYSSGLTYRYGFNGKENDKETVGTSQGTQDYGMRIYNPSLGRFLSVDPLTRKYPSWSPFAFSMNRPIDGNDLDGAEWNKRTDMKGNAITGERGGYDYVGYDPDGKPVSGSVSGAFYHFLDQSGQERTRIYASTPGNRDALTFEANGTINDYSITKSHLNSEDKLEESVYHFSISAGAFLTEIYPRAPWVAYGYNNYLGVQEVTGDKQNNPKIMEMIKTVNVSGTIGKDDDPWCGAFVSASMSGAGQSFSKVEKNYGSAWNSYWLNIWPERVALDNPAYGAIAVMSYGHVGIVVGETADGWLLLLGGNQAEGSSKQGTAVNIRRVSKDKVLGYTMPAGYKLPACDYIMTTWQFDFGPGGSATKGTLSAGATR